MDYKQIVIASHEFPPRIGGAGMVAFDLAVSLVKSGYQVTVITSYKASFSEFIKGRVYREEKAGFKLIKLPIFYNLWFVTYPLLFNSVVPKDCSHLIFNDFAISYLYKRRDANLYIVHMLHGKEKYLKFHSFFKSVVLRFNKVFIRNLNSSNLIICVSEFIKDWLLCIDGFNLEAQVSVLKNQVDTSLFHPVLDIPDEFKLYLDGEVFVSASRLVSGKGYSRMLKIFSDINSSSKGKYFWVIAGDGDYRSQFESEVIACGLQGNVIFLGAVDRSYLRFYYSQADLFWLLSEYEEACPLVYLEAAACGAPVMGNDLGGVKEVIEHDVNGYVTKTNVDVIRLLESKSYKKLRVSGLNEKDSYGDMFLNVLPR